MRSNKVKRVEMLWEPITMSEEIKSSDVSKESFEIIVIKTILKALFSVAEANLLIVAHKIGERVGETAAQKLVQYLNLIESNLIESEKKVTITNHLISSFPEDWQADLESQKERWIKQKYPSQTIRYLILKHLLHMIWVYIQIKIENIWLPKSSSTKEIE